MNYLCAFFVSLLFKAMSISFSPIWHCMEQIHNNVIAFVLYGTRVFQHTVIIMMRMDTSAHP
jgi:hypothetical protein